MKKFGDYSIEQKKINDLCIKYNIKKYSISVDNRVDVNGSVELKNMNLSEIEIPFGVVNGYFDCSNNQLTTLKNLPTKIIGSLYVNNNHLVKLDGCTKEVGMNFSCAGNNLLSLYGGPIKVGNHYNLSDNIYLKYLGGITSDAKSYSINGNNNLPSEIIKYKRYITNIIKNQYGYSIWNGTSLNLTNFNKLVNEHIK